MKQEQKFAMHSRLSFWPNLENVVSVIWGKYHRNARLASNCRCQMGPLCSASWNGIEQKRRLDLFYEWERVSVGEASVTLNSCHWWWCEDSQSAFRRQKNLICNLVLRNKFDANRGIFFLLEAIYVASHFKECISEILFSKSWSGGVFKFYKAWFWVHVCYLNNLTTRFRMQGLTCVFWGAVVAQWIRPRALKLEVPGSNLLAGSSSALGQGTLYPYYLVPRKGLKAVGPLVACL